MTTARRPQPVGPDGLRVAMTPLPTPRGNPFIRQLATELVAGGCTLTGASLRAAWHADVLHLHWPDHAVSRDGWSAAGTSMCNAPNGSRSPLTANGV